MTNIIEILSSVLDPRNALYEKIVNARLNLEVEIAKMIEDIRREQITILGYEQGSMPISFRVKSMASFKEKIVRNSYIKKWGINGDLDGTAAFNIVCSQLTDLIGARINCLFESDEELIYNYLRARKDEYRHLNLCFDENTEMKNGKQIQKFSGKIEVNNQLYSFEIQVKSSINNLWGEIEHSSVYKRRDYIPNNAVLQKEVIEQSYKILHGSDSQLKAILTEKIKEQELKKSLFFEYCKTECEISEFQAKDFELFYDLFTNNKNFSNAFDVFLSKKIVGEVFNTIRWDITFDEFDEERKNKFLTTIRNSEKSFRLDKMEKLFQILIDPNSTFVEYVLYQIIQLKAPFEYEDMFEGVDDEVIDTLDSYEEQIDQKDDVPDDRCIREELIYTGIFEFFGKEI